MSETSLFWAGTTTGDAGPYSDDQFSDMLRDIFTKDNTVEGVISGLDVSKTNSPPVVTIAAGKALVDGKMYINTASVGFSVPAPGSDYYYYTVVLRKSWAAQTVRLALLGPSAVGYPAVTQTDGVTWEIEVAQVSVHYLGEVTANPVLRPIRSPLIAYRQGGNETDWTIYGTTLYQNPYTKIEIGTSFVNFQPGEYLSDTLTVNFGAYFDDKPMVLITPMDKVANVTHVYLGPDFHRFSVNAIREDTGINSNFTFFWMAIGLSRYGAYGA